MSNRFPDLTPEGKARQGPGVSVQTGSLRTALQALLALVPDTLVQAMISIDLCTLTIHGN